MKRAGENNWQQQHQRAQSIAASKWRAQLAWRKWRGYHLGVSATSAAAGSVTATASMKMACVSAKYQQRIAALKHVAREKKSWHHAASIWHRAKTRHQRLSTAPAASRINGISASIMARNISVIISSIMARSNNQQHGIMARISAAARIENIKIMSLAAA